MQVKKIYRLTILFLATLCLLGPAQVALAGYSAGGWGAWYMLLGSSEKFSSAIMLASLPVLDPADNLFENFPKGEELVANQLDEWIKRLPSVPIYLINSRGDELFPFRKAQQVYQALLEDDRRVEFNALDGVGHFASEGYIDPLRKTVPWLLDTWDS